MERKEWVGGLPLHWMGTISREVGLFGVGRFACVTGRALCASDQVGKIGEKEEEASAHAAAHGHAHESHPHGLL